MNNPKQLLLIDGIGALLSAFFIGVVLVHYNELVGVPIETLYLLATIPIFFAIFDFYHYKFNQNFASPLRIIAIANFLYCILSVVLLFVHSDTLTTLGYIYFMLELIIVLFLAQLELKIAKK